MGRLFTSGQLAREIGLLQYHVRALSVKGKIPFRVCGGDRFYDEADIPQIIAAATEAGYLKSPSRTYESFVSLLASIGLDELQEDKKRKLFEALK